MNSLILSNQLHVPSQSGNTLRSFRHFRQTRLCEAHNLLLTPNLNRLSSDRKLCIMSSQQANKDSQEEQSFFFKNCKGEELNGIFLDAGSVDVVILCHGYMANMQNCQFPFVAATLAHAGISSFRFDHACAINTKSERKGPFLMGNHDDEVQDMQAAVQFVRRMGKHVLCLLGHSKGGMNVVLYGARHGDVPKMVNLSGRFCPRDGLQQRFGEDILGRLAAQPEGILRTEPSGMQWMMTEKGAYECTSTLAAGCAALALQDFRARAELDMEAAAQGIPATVQVLVLHGTNDATIPYQEAEQCAALIPNAKLQLIDGADHNYRRHGRQLADAIVAFVGSQ